MPSELKSETARTNGAKSHGPVTPEGRAKSSRNALRHGLSSQSVVLPHEDGEQFQQLVQDHIDQFQPQTAVEMDLVETMAAARWRLRRLYAVETAVFDNEMERRAEDIDDQFTDISDVGRLGWVFKN